MKDLFKQDWIKDIDNTCISMVKSIRSSLINNYPEESVYYNNLPVSFIPDFIVSGHQYIPAIEKFLSKKIPNLFKYNSPFDEGDIPQVEEPITGLAEIDNFLILAPYSINHGFDFDDEIVSKKGETVSKKYIVPSNTYKLILGSVRRTDINRYYYSLFNSIGSIDSDEYEYDLSESEFDDYTIGNKTYNCMVIRFKLSKKILLDESKN